jgi:hypothetical protein
MRGSLGDKLPRHRSKQTPGRTTRACLLVILIVSLRCAPSFSRTIAGQLVAREPLCLAVEWIATLPPGLEGPEPPDTLLLRPSQGPPARDWTRDYDLWGNAAPLQSQQDRTSAASLWGMGRDSLHILGYSLLETLEIVLVKPDSNREADWFYTKDLGPSMRGRVRLTPFECGARLAFVP